MKINAWTLLAVVLILSAIVGLGLRQIGSSSAGSRVVDDKGFQITCPKSVRVDSGVPYEFECQISNESEQQENITISADEGSLIEPERDGTYVLKASGTEVLPGRVYVSARLRTHLSANSEERLVAYIPLPLEIGAWIDTTVRYNPVLYVGAGLLAIQSATLLIAPLLYLGAAVRGKLSKPNFVRRLFVAIDVLFLSLILQFLLLMIFFFVITWLRAGSPSLDDHHWGSFRAGAVTLFLFAWLIYFMRWITFERPVPVEWRRWPKGNESAMPAGTWPATWWRLIVVILVGILTCLIAFLVNSYWFSWMDA